MADSTAFLSESLGACHMYAFYVDARTLGAYVLEYTKSSPAYHMNGSWHVRKDGWGNCLAMDVNAFDGDEKKEHAFFKNTLVPLAKRRGLAITCGVGPFHVRNHSIGDGLHLHLDIGHYSNLGERRNSNGYPTSWHGRASIEPWAVLTFQKSNGLVADSIAGPATKKKLQKIAGVEQDGILGPKSWRAIQKMIGTKVDGQPGVNTYHALTQWVDKNCK